MTEEAVIKVGMADLRTSRGLGMIRTSGLGSCIGMTLYDPIHKVGGMVHVMLPSSEIAKETFGINRAKYADTAIPELIERMSLLGASFSHLQAKMAGGAQMFSFVGVNESLRIGQRNIESCKQILEQLQIPLFGEDTGGNYGRTIELQCETGILVVKSVNKGVKEI